MVTSSASLGSRCGLQSAVVAQLPSASMFQKMVVMAWPPSTLEWLSGYGFVGGGDDVRRAALERQGVARRECRWRGPRASSELHPIKTRAQKTPGNGEAAPRRHPQRPPR